MLGITVMPSEAETFWTEFLRSLTRRGLRGVCARLRWELRSISLHWNCEQVSYAAFGPDDARRAPTGFKLAAQAKNLHVDAAISDILVQMGGLQQVFAAERASWRVEKDNQQGVLTFG